MSFGVCDGEMVVRELRKILKSRSSVWKRVRWLLGLMVEGDSASQSKAPESQNLPWMG